MFKFLNKLQHWLRVVTVVVDWLVGSPPPEVVVI